MRRSTLWPAPRLTRGRGVVFAAHTAAAAGRRRLATVTEANDTARLTKVTALPNGVRIATEELPGHFSAVGVYVDAGSRYEAERLTGVSHLLDRLAFKSTSVRSSNAMLERLESLGGNYMCTSSRESIMYQSAVFNRDLETMAGLLAEAVRDPCITEEEVDLQRDTAFFEISQIWEKPELILPELIHSAAFKNNTLGNPVLCPEEKLPHMSAALVHEYRNLFFRPERLVLAFAGIPHEQSVKLGERYFADMKYRPYPSTSSSSQKLSATSGLLKSMSTVASPLSFSASNPEPFAPAHFTGGTQEIPRAAGSKDEFTHLYIAFEGLAISDPDMYALAVLQSLLGGGGSFSAGGPGKGMYTRLFTNVLNQFGWVEHALAFNHSYTDSGLFGISASCTHEAAHAIADVICHELSLTFTTGRGCLQNSEVQRAKNQLRSSLLMNLESRMVELEDLGRQVQVHGRKVGTKEMCDKIDALTVDDVRRVARRVLTGQVVNLGHGTGRVAAVMQGETARIGDVNKTASRHGLGRRRSWL